MVMTGTLLPMLRRAARRDITEGPAYRFATWGSEKKKKKVVYRATRH